LRLHENDYTEAQSDLLKAKEIGGDGWIFAQEAQKLEATLTSLLSQT
jgi:hypothetical protein